jgi:hypothetical protein
MRFVRNLIEMFRRCGATNLAQTCLQFLSIHIY